MAQDYKYRIEPIWANNDYYVRNLVENMRRQDKEELEKIGVKDVHMEVRESILASDEAYVAYDNHGMVIVIYGVISRKPGGQIWCLGTNNFYKYKKSFVCTCNGLFKKWRRKYHVLWNFVSKENTLSIRWLSACGARFDKGYMVGDNEFWKFAIGGE